MGWKNWPYWLKGGTTGVILELFFVFIFLMYLFNILDAGQDFGILVVYYNTLFPASILFPYIIKFFHLRPLIQAFPEYPGILPGYNLMESLFLLFVIIINIVIIGLVSTFIYILLDKLKSRGKNAI